MMSEATSPIKILTLVEATTINAVAKSVIQFHQGARKLNEQFADFPALQGCIVTFERKRQGAQTPNAFVNAAREMQLQVEVIPERRRFDLRTLSLLRRAVELERPDLIVSHSVKSHFLVWRSKLWRKYPWVAFHHGYTTTDFKMRGYNWLDRWSLPKADRLVTVCFAFAQQLADLTRVNLDKITVQHNCVRPQPKVDAEDVQALRARLGLESNERIVLAVGRLSKEKAHIDLLTAYKRLGDTNPELSCRLVIVGEGPERGRLEEAAQAFQLNEQVVFAGHVHDVQIFYAASNVLVLPSHSEGSPYVLLEAMGAHLPIVATAVGGVPEIVDNNESALLVAPGDSHAMAVAIASVLIDPELARALTLKAFALVATRYSIESYVSSVINIFRGVLQSRQKNQNG